MANARRRPNQACPEIDPVGAPPPSIAGTWTARSFRDPGNTYLQCEVPSNELLAFTFRPDGTFEGAFCGDRISVTHLLQGQTFCDLEQLTHVTGTYAWDGTTVTFTAAAAPWLGTAKVASMPGGGIVLSDAFGGTRRWGLVSIAQLPP